MEPGAAALDESAYMDDLLRAFLNSALCDTAADCFVRTLDYGQMNVKAITKSGQPPSEKVSSDGETVGIVGYLWYVVRDQIGLDIKPLSLGKAKRGKPPPTITGDVKEALGQMFTRRILAGKVAGVFDPLGLAAPVTGRLKIDLNAVCRDNGDWDAAVDPRYLDVWVENLLDIQRLADLRVPRNVFGGLEGGKEVELLVCCDASEVIAVAAVYARVREEGGEFTCNLVTAKTKLVGKTTVPRAELRAVCLGASLGHTVKMSYEEHVKKVTYITDSAIALCWLN